MDVNTTVAVDIEKIASMPTFKFYYSGSAVFEQSGASQDKLKENLEKLKNWTAQSTQ